MSLCVPNKPAQTAPLARFCKRFREKHTAQASCGPIVIVAFGDSVTMGSTTNGEFIPEEVYHRRLARMLAEQFPGPATATLSVINSGIGGDTAAKALQRIDRDVIRYQPDLVLVAFAANDLGNDPRRGDEFEQSFRQIISTIRAQTSADIILLTPTQMAARDNDATTDKDYLRILMQFQNEGVVARFAEIIRNVGRLENLPVADIYAQWEQLEAEGTDMTAKLANGLNHPVAEMHKVHAREILRVILAGMSDFTDRQITGSLALFDENTLRF